MTRPIRRGALKLVCLGLLMLESGGCEGGEIGGDGGAGGEPTLIVSSSSSTAVTDGSGASGGTGGGGAGGDGGGGSSQGGGGANAGGSGGHGGAGGAGAGGTAGAGGEGQAGAGGSGGSGGAGGSGGQGGGGGQGGADCDGNPQGGVNQPDVVYPLPDVVVTTIAGSDVAGTDDGAGAAARFDNPVNVLADGDGGYIVADFDGGRIRLLDGGANVTTLTSDPLMARPFGLEMSTAGELLVQTDYNELGVDGGPNGGVIWGVDLATGAAQPIATQVGRPRGLARLANGLVVVSDILSHDVRLFDPATGGFTPLAGVSGCPGFADGVGAGARFNRPYGLAVTASGDVLVADQHNHRIRSIAIPSGVVTTIAGDGTPDHVDGLIADARFSDPVDLALDASGAVFITEIGNHRIRRLAGGIVETVAGGPAQGFADGDGEAARFNGQEGIAVSADGATIVVADGTLGVPGPFHRIRRIVIPQ